MKFPGNLGDMFSQVQQIQENMGRVQEDLEKQEVESSAGGGMVTVRMNGAQVITALRIDKSVIDPSEAEMLEDLVRAAVNEAVRKSRDLMKQEMAKLTGGLSIPGLG